MKLNYNFHKGGEGVLEKNPFCGGGMDIFWNYTLQRDVTVKQFNKHLSTEFHVIKEALLMVCVQKATLIC